MDLRLIAIGENGCPEKEVPLTERARSICAQTAVMYQTTPLRRPWGGYLAELDGEVVGACAFKTPPRDGQVEIAYFTFPEWEGQGMATRMARDFVHPRSRTHASSRTRSCASRKTCSGLFMNFYSK